MATEAKPSVVMLNRVRLAFPDLFEAVQFDGKGEYRYGATFFMEKGGPNHQRMSAAIMHVATEAWKARAQAMVEEYKGNSNKFCLTNGDTKNYEGAEGCMVLSARRSKKKGRPLLLDQRKNNVGEDTGMFYSGCYVNAQVEVWAQVKDYPGIRCTLLAVQFYSDGDAFSGGTKPSADPFEELADSGDAPASLV